jgi:hypothetical protein
MMYSGDPNEEASDAQIGLIYRLIDRRYVRKKTASKIIELLLEEMEIDNGLSNLKNIQRPT